MLCFSRQYDKNAVNQGFWSKTAVFSISAAKMHCLLMFFAVHSPQSSVVKAFKPKNYSKIEEKNEKTLISC